MENGGQIIHNLPEIWLSLQCGNLEIPTRVGMPPEPLLGCDHFIKF